MRILKVDLTKEKVVFDQIPSEFERLIGGKGIASKLLFDVPARIDPFDPRNIIIFGIGPISGLPIPGASRVSCVFKSPLTGGYCESQCGGRLAREFRRANLYFVYITGKAKKPSVLVLNDKKAEIRDASEIWGMDTFEAEKVLRKEYGGEVAVIGQAGEKLVKFANISHRRGHQFGRGGCGAIMGSKNLKAIVVQGEGEVEIENLEEFEKFRNWLIEEAKEKLQSLSKYGTPGMVDVVNEVGAFPTRYWSKGRFEGAKKINAESLLKYVKRKTACYACNVACGLLAEVDGEEVEGPEYETIFALGALCENDDLKSIIKAAKLCDMYGIDTISAGNAIAFLMECCERGEVEYDAKFGDGEAVVEIVRKIAFREGIGDVLAEGTRIAAEKLKVSVEPVHCKGLEPPGYDPRSLLGMALAYAVSQRGACHMRSCAYRPNLVGAVNRLSTEGQAKLVKELEDLYCVVDSLVTCRFLSLPIIGPLQWKEISELYRIVTNRKISISELASIGEEIWKLTKLFNEREGLKDEVPEAFVNKPLILDGDKLVLRKEEFEKMIDEYYRLRGLKIG